jgi:hypothetical protein
MNSDASCSAEQPSALHSPPLNAQINNIRFHASLKFGTVLRQRLTLVTIYTFNSVQFMTTNLMTRQFKTLEILQS